MALSKRLSDLQPAAFKAATAAGENLRLLGIPYADTSTLRTQEEQYAFWCQGRKPLVLVNDARRIAGLWSIKDAENKYTITNCDGIKTKSAHQSGLALDRVPVDARGSPCWPPASDPRWIQIAMVMEAHGFEWGGRWKDFQDLPHYTYKGV